MKEEEVKLRISHTVKTDFQNICETEHTTMSNKLVGFIVEEVKNKKPIKQTYRKKLIKFGIINNHDRLYPKSELTKTIFDKNGFEYTELDRLNKEPLYGQFGYVKDGSTTHQYNATHMITNLDIEEDWLEGDVTILNNSIIPILDNLVFRPRSFGETDNKGRVYNLEIISFDAVLKSEDSFI